MGTVIDFVKTLKFIKTKYMKREELNAKRVQRYHADKIRDEMLEGGTPKALAVMNGTLLHERGEGRFNSTSDDGCQRYSPGPQCLDQVCPFYVNRRREELTTTFGQVVADTTAQHVEEALTKYPKARETMDSTKDCAGFGTGTLKHFAWPENLKEESIDGDFLKVSGNCWATLTLQDAWLLSTDFATHPLPGVANLLTVAKGFAWVSIVDFASLIGAGYTYAEVKAYLSEKKNIQKMNQVGLGVRDSLWVPFGSEAVVHGVSNSDLEFEEGDKTWQDVVYVQAFYFPPPEALSHICSRVCAEVKATLTRSLSEGHPLFKKSNAVEFLKDRGGVLPDSNSN